MVKMKKTSTLLHFSKEQLLLISAIATLVTLPLKNIFISLATISFVIFSISNYFQKEKNYSSSILLPALYFVTMIISLLWTKDSTNSMFSLQKHSPMIFVPLAFIFIPKISRSFLNKIIKGYSYGMVLYALYFLFAALLGYFKSNSISVFFHTNLVPSDPGVIYISVFASFAFFYFLQLEQKKTVEKIAFFILAILIFLLSSKSIITIDFIVIICYYAFFSKVPSSTKTFTISAVFLFLAGSIYYVKEVRERFLIEYETAFIDNTLNYNLSSKSQNIYNVSINEAWTKKDFHQNNFFPGTALRVYQARVFSDAFSEKEIFLKGFGIEASQDYIRKKAKENNLNPIYGEYNFHNQYLQTYAELGLLGFIVLLLMLLLNIKNAFSNKDFLHIAFAITMIVLFLSESFFCRQRGIIFFIMLYCLFNSLKEKAKQS